MLKIIKPFPYSVDGVHSVLASPGGDASAIPERLRAGLIREGYLAEAKVIAPAVENKAVVAPDDVSTNEVTAPGESAPARRPGRPRKA